MAVINKLDNTAKVVYDGKTIVSNTVETILALAPTILKVVDKLTAALNEVLTYTVTVTNLGLNTITSLPLTDDLPAGCSYVVDSFTVNGTPATPTVTNNTLAYTIPTIAAAGIVTIQYKVTVVGGSV